MRRSCGHAGAAEEARVWDNEDLNYRREGSAVRVLSLWDLLIITVALTLAD